MPPISHSSIYMLSPAVRYVATYQRGELRLGQRAGLQHASAAESDRYEELFVNPALLTLATQRGAVDCGGLVYLVVRYAHFFQIVVRLSDGHLSVSVEPYADVQSIAEQILESLRRDYPPASHDSNVGTGEGTRTKDAP